jgi:hypothetical protein
MSDTPNADTLRQSVADILETGPVPGSVWQDHKGRQCIVLACAVVERDNSAVVVFRKYPLEDGDFTPHFPLAAARTLADFLDCGFTQVPECEL